MQPDEPIPHIRRIISLFEFSDGTWDARSHYLPVVASPATGSQPTSASTDEVLEWVQKEIKDERS